MKSLFALALTCFVLMLPHVARAEDFVEQETFEDNFSGAETVSNKELDTQRGGALNLRGVMFDFSFFSQIRYLNDMHNINEVQTNTVTAADIQAGMTLPEIIAITNTLDGTYVGVDQVLEVATQGLPARLEMNALLNRIESSRQLGR